MDRRHAVILLLACTISSSVSANSERVVNDLSGLELEQIGDLIVRLQEAGEVRVLGDGTLQIESATVRALRENSVLRQVSARAGGWTPDISDSR